MESIYHVSTKLELPFISGDVDIRNKEIIQKSELKTKNMGRERNTSRELK